MEIILTIATLIVAHWQTIAIVIGGCAMIFDALKKKAFSQCLEIAIDLVRKVAIEELSGIEKRQAVVDAMYVKVPTWMQKMVSDQEAHQIAEKAYQLLRGELKETTTEKKLDS